MFIRNSKLTFCEEYLFPQCQHLSDLQSQVPLDVLVLLSIFYNIKLTF